MCILILFDFYIFLCVVVVVVVVVHERHVFSSLCGPKEDTEVLFCLGIDTQINEHKFELLQAT